MDTCTPTGIQPALHILADEFPCRILVHCVQIACQYHELNGTSLSTHAAVVLCCVVLNAEAL